MRILVAYNRYRQRVQGEQIAIDALIDLLETRGHHVAVHVEESVDTKADFWAKGKAAVSSIHSCQTHGRVASLIDVFKPDLVHFHNLYPRLGLPALAACESLAVPSLVSLHNYFLTCPIYKHFRDGRVCTDCTPRNTLPCLANDCRGNLIESLVYAGRSALAATMGIHHRFCGYIAQSQFARDLIVRHGVSPRQVHLLRNFVGDVAATEERQSAARPYAVFLGRIVAEKGIDDIIALARRMPELSIKVAGGALDSPEWRWPDNVEFLGQVSPPDAKRLLKNAFCLLFASRWFEMCPLVLLEAMRLKTAVIATRIGGIPELIADGERGLLYEPGDVFALESRVRQLLANEELRKSLVEKAFQHVTAVHSPETYYQGLLRVYRHVIGQKNGHDRPNDG